MSPRTPSPPRKAKHLIDFDNPPVRRSSPEAEARLKFVQHWVMSTLVVTTTTHLALGLVIAAASINGHLQARIGLVVVSAGVGLVGMVMGLAIHERKPLHPLVLLGLIPALIGLFIAF